VEENGQELFFIFFGKKWIVEENGISVLEANGYGHILKVFSIGRYNNNLSVMWS